MGVDLNWGMLTDSGANFGNALARVGQAIGEGRQKRKAANVLAQYAADPNPQTWDEGRTNELAKYFPDLLMQRINQRTVQEQQAGNVQLVHNAQGGDAGALDQLAVKLPEIWKTMSAEHRTEAAQHSKVFANFALGADTPEKWDAGIDLLSQQYPDAAQYKGKFDPNLRSSLVAQGEMTQQLYEQTKPQWMAPQPGGAIVNVRDPQAIADYNQGVGKGASPAPAADAAPADSVWHNMLQAESSGLPGVTGPQTPYGRAQGLAQVLPATAQAMAGKLGIPWQPELMSGASPEAAAYQEKLGRAYYDEGLAKYHGDTRRAAMYYHGGPDENRWGPKTRAYASRVAGPPQRTSNPRDVARPKTRSDFEALPSGTHFIDPNGNERVKP